MTTGRKVSVIFAVIFTVVGVALWQIFASLDMIVANFIQNTGTQVLQTQVKVSTVSLELKEGKAGISGMTIANPAGFNEPYAFSMDDIVVKLDVSSLGKSPLIIDEILVRQAKVFVEVDSNGTTNFDILKQNIDEAAAGYSAKKQAKTTAEVSAGQSEKKAVDGTAKAPDDADAEKSADELKLIIRKFRFEGGQLKAVSQLAPGKSIDQTLPVIQMENLGADRGGATAQQITIEMMRVIIAQVTEAAIRSGLQRAIDKEKENLMEKASDKLKGLFK